MKYNEALEFLFNSFSNYQNNGKNALRPGLKNIKILSNYFKKPENKFVSVHIGGTNGKGTTSTEISNLCLSLNLSVGLFTSPHIYDFRERIQVNGKKIKKVFISNFIKSNKSFFREYDFSFFELNTIMAFEYFCYSKVDIAIIEVGLGGRFDSTNIINPLISLVTNVSYDHQNILGNNLKDIAKEKAGIIKRNKIFIKGESQSNIDHIFINECNNKKAFFLNADKEISIKTLSKDHIKRKIKIFYGKKTFKYTLSNPCEYYLKNFYSIFLVYNKIREFYKQDFSFDKLIKKKFNVYGRWNILSKKPLIISDGCHNIDAFSNIIKEINNLFFKNVIFIIGGVKDKNWDKIIELLPDKFFYVITKPSIERGISPNSLSTLFRNKNLKFIIKDDINKAVKYSKNIADKSDLIFIGGSLFLISDLDEK